MSEGTEKNHDNPQSGLLVSRSGFVPGTSEYEVGVSTNQPQRSVMLHQQLGLYNRGGPGLTLG
jgi:hypothetical protein